MSDLEQENLELMPGWRRALRSFVQHSYKPGDVVLFEWLERELGQKRPDNETAMTGKERLAWLKQWDEFRSRLLDEHQLALWKDEDTPGYKVLTASEHLRLSQEEGRRRVRVAIRWQAEMLVNVDVSNLPDKERAEHAEALARISRLKSMARKELPLLPVPQKAPD